MSLRHTLLAAAYLPLRIRNAFLSLKASRNRSLIRVLIFHDVSIKDEESFRRLIFWLSQRWSFITPDQFSAILSGNLEISKNSLLLTFDDGFKSNRRVVEKILNPMGIKAIFFVLPEFISCVNDDECSRFISKNLFPDTPSYKVPKDLENMTWSDLNYLVKSGHTIGAHSKSHARLSNLSADELCSEIISGADYLGKVLGVKICHFAYPFGDIKSFSAEALAIARSRFKYIYTGLRGNNSLNTKQWAIRRDALSPIDSKFLVGSFLEGGADPIYEPGIKVYEGWGSKI